VNSDSPASAPSAPAPPAPAPARPRAKYEIQLDRHEAKYIIPPAIVPRLREFIRPFCEPDPYARGSPPEYLVTTLQFDTFDHALHRAKETEAVSRFKIRARIYGEPGESPVFAEVKRKVKGTIIKSRAKIPFDQWNEELIWSKRIRLTFKSRNEEAGFYEFARLVREIGARPVCLVRYRRESYFGVHDPYARVTFDRELRYQPTSSWTDWGRHGRWFAMDTPLLQGKGEPFSGVILELKTLSDAPQWMLDLIMQFNLERTGNCKYSTAIWQESVFAGENTAPFAAALFDL